MDMGLSLSRTTSFLEYQKIIRNKFLEEGEKIGATMVPTKYGAEEIHNKIWDSIQPAVSDIIQPIE